MVNKCFFKDDYFFMVENHLISRVTLLWIVFIVIVFIPCRKAAALVGYWECHSKRNLRGISLIVQSKRWLWNLALLLQKQERSLISFLIKQPRAYFSIQLSVLHSKAKCMAFQLFLLGKLIIMLDSCRYLELPIQHLQLLLQNILFVHFHCNLLIWVYGF